MKYFENAIYTYFAEKNALEFIETVQNEYPKSKEGNFCKKNLSSKFEYINLIPKLLFGFSDQVDGDMPIITWVYDNTSHDTYWHLDSESDDSDYHVTVIAYLKIDKSGGGKFLTEQKTTTIDTGSVIVFPSTELHAADKYKSKIPRIFLKWIFKVDKKVAESFRD